MKINTPKSQRVGFSRHFSGTNAWLALRRISQVSILILFLGSVTKARQLGETLTEYSATNDPLESRILFIDVFFRLDPLAMLAQSLAVHRIATGAALTIITIIITLLLGRGWCGWICPLGTCIDLVSPKQQFLSINQRFDYQLRRIKHSIFLIILFMSLFGGLTLMILDPITFLYRSLTLAIWPGIERVVLLSEKALYPVTFLSEAVARFDSWVRPLFLPNNSSIVRMAWIFGIAFIGVIAMNWITPRFWCRYLCPLGSLLGLLSKFALIRRQVDENCKNCALCASACPMNTIKPERGFASDPAECTMCLECIPKCARSAQSFKPIVKPAPLLEYDPNRRQALKTFGLAAAASLMFVSDTLKSHPDGKLLRPPGTQEDALLSSCIRCGICIQTCPTGGLQSSWGEAGLEGLWTPILVPRIGYCDYSCNACGQACPTQAIQSLSLEEKRRQEIGKAYIDQDRCLAWSDHIACIVCEEMCPLPDKAIYLETHISTDPNGDTRSIQVPIVFRDRCIGCGICETQCPLIGPAAIQVWNS